MHRNALPLLAVLSVLAACSSPRPAAVIPEEIVYLSRSDWGASEPISEMQPHTLSRITIHHTATLQDPARSLADKMLALQRFSQSAAPLGNGRIKEIWPDIPYHFYVNVDGAVAEGRPLQYAGDSNTPYDPAGHLLIVVEGNFEEEALSEAQRRTLNALVPAFADRWDIPAERIASHKDFAATLCPGRNLYSELPRLRALVSEAQ